MWLLAAEEAADISLDQRQSLLNGALREQFGLDEQQCQRFWLFEAFDGYLIARGNGDGKLYRIPYTIDGDEVTLDSAQEVTTAYVPVAESCSFMSTEADATAESGTYPITVLKAGWGAGFVSGQSTPHYYPDPFVKLVAEAASGVPFGRRHPDQRGGDPTGATDPERIAGWLEGGSYVDGSARSAIKLFTAEADLRSKLDDARSNKKLNLFAVSMLAAVGYRPGIVEGKKCLVAESLGKLFSVDLCQRGGAGGEFLTAASFAGNDLATAQEAAVIPQSPAIVPNRTARSGNRGGAAGATEGAPMKKSILQLLTALRQRNAARSAELSIEFATVAEADYPAFLEKVTTAVAEPPAADPAAPKPMTTAEAQTILADAHRLQSRTRIETKLTESKLSAPAAKLVREHLESTLTAEAKLADAAIDAEIVRVRDAFASYSNVGRVRPRVEVVLDSADKMQLAMEAAMGVKDSLTKGVPAFRGLRQAYTAITGDDDLSQLTRAGWRQAMTSEAVITGDFPNILLNSMTKRLLQDWAELSIDGLSQLYRSAPISDYKLQDRVREGFFPELAVVNENGTYQEIAYPTDELVTYQLVKYGNLLSISEETIRNDDLGAIARFPGRLARAGRWTLKNKISSFFIANPNYTADAVAWFATGHNNLGSAALSQDALIAAEISLLMQTEKDSGEPLGLPLTWVMVPAALKATAIQINQTNTAGSNAFFQRFGANNERIIVNEKLTDVTDWYYGTDQNNAPFIEVGFLDGIENPQIFLANQPTIGTQFTQDALQYKVKMVFAIAITDYRGVGKNVVAG
jgi:hypothetical protein